MKIEFRPKHGLRSACIFIALPIYLTLLCSGCCFLEEDEEACREEQVSRNPLIDEAKHNPVIHIVDLNKTKGREITMKVGDSVSVKKRGSVVEVELTGIRLPPKKATPAHVFPRFETASGGYEILFLALFNLEGKIVDRDKAEFSIKVIFGSKIGLTVVVDPRTPKQKTAIMGGLKKT